MIRSLGRLPFFKILAVVQVALLARRHLGAMSAADRRRIAELARHGHKLSPAERQEFIELAAKLERHTSAQDVIDWWDINPRDWISESAQVREQIYANIPPAAKPKDKKGKGAALPDLSYGYVYKFTPVMERRLQQAGVRLAAYLNDVYSKPQPVGGGQTR